MHILFDFDGTLVDSRPVVEEELALLLTKYGMNQRDLMSVEQIYHLPFFAKMKMVYFLYRKKNELTQSLLARVSELSYFDGIPEVLEALSLEGETLSILSSNTRENICAFLNLQAMNPFQWIQGVQGIKSKKSSLREFQTKISGSKSLIYITDDYRDVLCCRELEIPVLAVSWGFTSKELLQSAKPKYLVSSPKELLDKIQVLKSE